jgi:hypothetical protein
MEIEEKEIIENYYVDMKEEEDTSELEVIIHLIKRIRPVQIFKKISLKIVLTLL